VGNKRVVFADKITPTNKKGDVMAKKKGGKAGFHPKGDLYGKKGAGGKKHGGRGKI
jgi:hypothetical protein